MATEKTLFSSHSVQKTNSETSGSYTFWSDTPVTDLSIGDSFVPVDGSPTLNITKIDISDEVIGEVNGKLQRQWQIRIEGSTEEQGDGSNTDVTYDFTINSESKSGFMTVIKKGSSPNITVDVGNNFRVPGIGLVKCTNVQGSSSYDDKGIQIWTVTYQGSSGSSDDEDPDIPDDGTSTTYELNGITVRTVAGTLLVLQRSADNAMRKTITVYNSAETPLATIGSTYQGGIALSENVMKETIKKNGVVTKTYYKHTIEVEI